MNIHKTSLLLRVISLILTALLLSSALISCGSGGSGNQPSAETSSPDTVSVPDTAADETPETVSPDPKIEAADCDGAGFAILSRERPEGNFCYPYKEFFASEENGDVINDAVFARNLAVTEKYNITLELPENPDVQSATNRAIMAGEDSYDIVVPMHLQAYNMSVAGHLTNIADIPYVDIEKPYWRTSVMKNASIGGCNYFATGDLNLAALNGVGVLFFNKELAAERKIDDLYDTVRAGDWTLDRFTDYCRGITMDLNGDQQLNGEDMFGLTVNGFVWQPLFAATNSVIVGKDSEDIPYFAWDTPHNLEVIERIVNFVNDRESVILVNQFPELQDANGWGQASIDMFNEARALFWAEQIYGVHTLRNMDTDFGILPYPKYNDKQEDYTAYMHCGWTSTTCVPITNTDLDLTGRILEDLAYQSSITVRPAYYDVTLKGKISRDNDSGDMLDIIYTRVNLDPVLLIGGLPVDNTMRNFLIKNNLNFASEIESLKSQCVAKLASDVEALLKLAE